MHPAPKRSGRGIRQPINLSSSVASRLQQLFPIITVKADLTCIANRQSRIVRQAVRQLFDYRTLDFVEHSSVFVTGRHSSTCSASVSRRDEELCGDICGAFAAVVLCVALCVKK